MANMMTWYLVNEINKEGEDEEGRTEEFCKKIREKSVKHWTEVSADVVGHVRKQPVNEEEKKKLEDSIRSEDHNNTNAIVKELLINPRPENNGNGDSNPPNNGPSRWEQFKAILKEIYESCKRWANSIWEAVSSAKVVKGAACGAGLGGAAAAGMCYLGICAPWALPVFVACVVAGGVIGHYTGGESNTPEAHQHLQ